MGQKEIVIHDRALEANKQNAAKNKAEEEASLLLSTIACEEALEKWIKEHSK